MTDAYIILVGKSKDVINTW